MKTKNLGEVLCLIIITILMSNLTSVSFATVINSATIYVQPRETAFTLSQKRLGDTFEITVRIADYSNVAGWQAKLVWDKSLLSTSESDVSYASDFIFPQDSYPSISAAIGDFNATHGYVMMTTTAYGVVEYNGSDAGLMRIRFAIVKEPESEKTLSCVLWLEPVDTWTIDENIEENTETLIGGSYSIAWASPQQPYLEIIIAVIAIIVVVAILGLFFVKKRKEASRKR